MWLRGALPTRCRLRGSKRCRAALATALHKAAEERVTRGRGSTRGGRLDREGGEAEGEEVCHGFEVAQVQKVVWT